MYTTMQGRVLWRLAITNVRTRMFRTTKSSSSSGSSQRSGIAGGDALVLGLIPLGLLAILGEAYVRSDLDDSERPDECSYPATTKLLQSHHVRTLERDGIVVIPNALDHVALQAARKDLFRFLQSSNDDENDNRISTTNAADVRQDRVAWVRTSSFEEDNTGANDINGYDAVGNHMDHCIRLIRGVTHALTEHSYSAHNGSAGGSKSRNSSIQQQQEGLPPALAGIKYRIPRKCQLAWYPGDGSALYKRHLDQCNNSVWELGLLEWLRLSDYRARSMTVILYLNQADRPKDHGGALRCWVSKGKGRRPSKTKETHEDKARDNDSENDALFYPPFDVQPTGGTMVIFESDKVEHMVLSSIADRYAITSWVSQVPGT